MIIRRVREIQSGMSMPKKEAVASAFFENVVRSKPRLEDFWGTNIFYSFLPVMGTNYLYYLHPKEGLNDYC